MRHPGPIHLHNFNPRTPCGVRRGAARRPGAGRLISIHAPRVGCDGVSQRPGRQDRQISIHAPRVGCDSLIRLFRHAGQKFQSTHPVWGATSGMGSRTQAEEFQSTHPVWGATVTLAIDSPRESIFQSTHPVWGATSAAYGHGKGSVISIHAPRVGCDFLSTSAEPLALEFQSTHPVWGATSRRASRSDDTPIFQSTHPVWGATVKRFSIHSRNHNFNPRTPCGVRLCSTSRTTMATPISIHAPRVGCDRTRPPRDWEDCYFNPRTPCGVRL